jgi:hypothetical protein
MDGFTTSARSQNGNENNNVPIVGTDTFLGKNTPERKDYIMDKLVVPLEE